MKVFSRFNKWLDETDSNTGIWIYNVKVSIQDLGVWCVDNVSCPILNLLWYRPRNWWHYHHYQQPLYAAGEKLMKLNPDVMPDTVSVRTWTRLWLPLVCEVRFMKLNEKVTAGAEMCKKNGDMAVIQCGYCRWLWLYRNHEHYVVIPKGMNKEE